MYRKKINLTLAVLTTILLITLSCGCVSDDSGSKKTTITSPLKIEHIELAAVLNDKWQSTASTHIETDYPAQNEQSMYMGYEPPRSEIVARFNILNDGTTPLESIQVKVELPGKWTLNWITEDYIPHLEPNTTHRVQLGVRSERAPRYMGMDTDDDGFADTFNPNNNELGTECYTSSGHLKYPQIFTDGLEAKDYEFKVQVWTSDVSKVSIEYTVSFKI